MSGDKGKIIKFSPNPNNDHTEDIIDGSTAAKVIQFDPGVYDIDALTNLNPAGTERRRDEAIERDRRNEENFKRAQARSLQQEEAKMAKKKRRGNFKVLVELALLIAGLLAIVKGLIWVEEKYPEEYPTRGSNGDAAGNSLDEITLEDVNKKVEVYGKQVMAIISGAKGDVSKQYYDIINGLTNYLLAASEDDLEYRAAVLAIANNTNEAECVEFLNHIFGELSREKHKGATHLLEVSSFSEYLSLLGILPSSPLHNV